MLRTSLGRDIGMGIGLAAALDPYGTIDTNTFEGRFEWRTNGDQWKAKVIFDELFYQTLINNAHLFPPGAFNLFPNGVISNSNIQLQKTRLQSRVEYTGWPSHHFSLGFGAETNRIKQNSESRNYTLINGLTIPLGTVQAIEDPNLLTFGGRTFSNDLQFIYLQDEWHLYQDWALTWGGSLRSLFRLWPSI